MKKNRYEEDDFEGFVQDLIKSGRLDDKEIGISKLMLDKGYDNLSEKQKYVFDKAIEKNSVEYCDFCSTPISWCEMMEALDNGGLCIGCQHTKEKIERE